MDRCRSCDAPIRWATSLATGKALPLDLEPTPAGNVMVHGGGEEEPAAVAEVLAGDRRARALAAGIDLYVSHFATCPDAAAYRKKQPVATYGPEGKTASEAMRDLATAAGVPDAYVSNAIRTAGAHERPPVTTIEDLDDARPAVYYYAARLVTAIAAELDHEREHPVTTPAHDPDVPNNRPDYAPDRRPGDPLDAGRTLVILHLAADDVHTVAALIEAGAAALKYAPGSATDFVELNSRRRAVKLGRDVARALRLEHARRTTPPPAPKKKRGS